jgi:hypothetical protein
VLAPGDADDRDRSGDGIEVETELERGCAIGRDLTARVGWRGDDVGWRDGG